MHCENFSPRSLSATRVAPIRVPRSGGEDPASEEASSFPVRRKQSEGRTFSSRRPGLLNSIAADRLTSSSRRFLTWCRLASTRSVAE